MPEEIFCLRHWLGVQPNAFLNSRLNIAGEAMPTASAAVLTLACINSKLRASSRRALLIASTNPILNRSLNRRRNWRSLNPTASATRATARESLQCRWIYAMARMHGSASVSHSLGDDPVRAINDSKKSARIKNDSRCRWGALRINSQNRSAPGTWAWIAWDCLNASQIRAASWSTSDRDPETLKSIQCRVMFSLGDEISCSTLGSDIKHEPACNSCMVPPCR